MVPNWRVAALVIGLAGCGVLAGHAAGIWPWGTPLPETHFTIHPWTDGVVPYMFDDGTVGPVGVHADDQRRFEAQMARWERAFTIVDPSGVTKQYIDFRRCAGDCAGSYLLIRYNKLNDDGETECNNMSEPVGMELPNALAGRDGVTELNVRRGTCPDEGEAEKPGEEERTNQDDNTLLHELGHALGLWHEFNRVDAGAYLAQPGDPGDPCNTALVTRDVDLMPLLGNYDYDSVMEYNECADLKGNEYSRQAAQAKTNAAENRDADGAYIVDHSISPGIESRLLQYYAYGHNGNWGFFRSLHAGERRDAYLAPGVVPEGSPAIAHQGGSDYDVFVRGSDERLYWKGVRGGGLTVTMPDTWKSLGCCFGSDPAAISTAPGEIDVFVIGAESGRLIRKRYVDGAWQAATYVESGFPAGGIKQPAARSYLGPAVTSRGDGLLDVFVVRGDGRLALISLAAGEWSGWTTLGSGYEVAARPAAVALCETDVQLAIAVAKRAEQPIPGAARLPIAGDPEVALTSHRLYEPVVRFPGGPAFTLGGEKGRIGGAAPPGLAKRDDPLQPYRVLIRNSEGRLSHRFASGAWRDIGGMVKPGTGPAAVAEGAYGAHIAINGADLVGCDATCDDPTARSASGAYIEPGGVWVRHFR